MLPTVVKFSFLAISVLHFCVVLDAKRIKYHIVVGVFSPPGTTWEALVRNCYREVLDSLPLSSSHTFDLTFTPIGRNLTFSLNFDTIKYARKEIKTNSMSVVIGPFNEVIKMAAEDCRVPYIVLSKGEPITTAEDSFYSFHLLPSIQTVYKAVNDVTEKYAWDKVAILYENRYGLELIGQLLSRKNLIVHAWKMNKTLSHKEVRDRLLEVRQFAMRNIIVLCEPPVTATVFSVDPTEVDFSPYLYTNVNFTAFRYVGPSNHSGSFINNFNMSVIRDSLRLVLEAARLHHHHGVAHNLVCRTDTCYVSGLNLQPLLHRVTLNGTTGMIVFDQHNRRTEVHLEVVAMGYDGLYMNGYWDESAEHLDDRLKLFPIRNNSIATLPHPLGREKDPPFVNHVKNWQSMTGNERWEGFLIDLMEKIAEKLGFEYELYDSPDGFFGSVNDKGQWNGMIQELIVGNASMCLGAISITSERETVVDFSKPFMQKNFNILIKKPSKKPSIFQFLWPFHTYIWLLTLLALLVVGILLFLMDRMSPNSEDKVMGRFDLRESLWFIYASLVGAGTEVTISDSGLMLFMFDQVIPRTFSGRLLSGAWWFFSLILISSYTANLAAFLTVTKIETPVKSVTDLAEQTKIKYGTVKNTYANSFFRNSKIEIFKKMWTHMGQLHPDNMLDNSSMGIKRVKEGGYAFIWDTPINKFTTGQECDTMTVGEPFDPKGYGIGVPLGAAYRDDITMCLLNLAEEGIMRKIEQKWWSGGKCEKFSETSTGGSKELSFQNIAGVFVVLAAGICLAILACLVEALLRRARDGRRKRDRSLVDREGSSQALKSSIYLNGSQSTSFSRKESHL